MWGTKILETVLFTILFICAFVLFAAALTPFLRLKGKMADLPRHFIVQYAIAALFFMGLCGWLKMPQALYVFSATFGLCMMQIMPFLPAPKSKTPVKNARPLKVLQSNVLKNNLNAEMLYQLIEEEQPDVFTGAEITPRFADMLALLKPVYPYAMIHPQEGSYGLAVLSKYPFKEAAYAHLFSKDVPACIFTIDMQGTDITFCALHPPTPQRDVAARDGEFSAIAHRFMQGAKNLVVLGDFNATPWTPSLKDMIRNLHLKNAREGHGLYGTWPAFFPLPILRLPIDHVLYRGDLSVKNFKTGPFIGSDHLPTLTCFSVFSN